jgi:hypothetical protein
MSLIGHMKRHGAGCRAHAARPTLQAIIACLLFEAERIDIVARTVEDLKEDFEAFRAKVLARVDALQAAVDAATQNGSEVPPGVQSQIDQLAAEIEADTANDANAPAPASGTDNAPAGSGPSAGDSGMPEPVNQDQNG